jgi:hypothetical protein
MSERQKYRPSVFISYASRGTDAEFALALRSALVEHKIVVPAWRDKEDLRPGARAIADIQAGIAGCDFFLLLVSPRSITQSRWCPREWGRADRLRKTIVPLILETVPWPDLPLELEGIQWIDAQQGLQEALPPLLRLLGVTDAPLALESDPLDRDSRRIRAFAQVSTPSPATRSRPSAT